MNVKDKIITIHIDVADRHAVYKEAPAKLVCGNPFNIVFSFDEEWDEFSHLPKIARLVFWHRGKHEHIDIEFKGNVCSVPALYHITNLEIGAVIEDSICTTTGAFIECEKSIKCCDSVSVLGDDLIENINKALRGEDGKDGKDGIDGKDGVDGKDGRDGVDGKDGYTPVRGTDYWTPADKAEIKSYVDDAILGGKW